MVVAGSAGLFSAGVVTKEAHLGIHAGVNLYHKIRSRQVKPHDVLKAEQQLSNSAQSTEKVIHPDATFGHKKYKESLQNIGYHLDNDLSDREHKVFYNTAAKKAVVAYRGIDMHDPKGFVVIK